MQKPFGGLRKAPVTDTRRAKALEADAETVTGTKGLNHEGPCDFCLRACTSFWGQWKPLMGESDMARFMIQKEHSGARVA